MLTVGHAYCTAPCCLLLPSAASYVLLCRCWRRIHTVITAADSLFFFLSFFFSSYFSFPPNFALLFSGNKRHRLETLIQCAELSQLLSFGNLTESKQYSRFNSSALHPSLRNIYPPRSKRSDGKSVYLRQGVTLKHCSVRPAVACNSAGHGTVYTLRHVCLVMLSPTTTEFLC